MPRSPEAGYIHNIEKPNSEDIHKIGLQAEELTMDAINSQMRGFSVRLSTESEDSGVKDIGAKATIDAVAYFKEKPVMGIQVTTAEGIKAQQEKMKSLIAQPFIRLEEMKPTDHAIPKVLVFIKREMASAYAEHPELKDDPKALNQVLDGMIKSLQYDLTRTKNPQEQHSIKQLIAQLIAEQKK